MTSFKEPTKVGYIFEGWYGVTSTITNISTTQLGSVTLNARWSPRNDIGYTVEHYKQQRDGSY
ncbi:MAG: hypothetical protein ACK5LC_14185, partial [Coprobacillaceae bacterium]